jgi:hypothetical protein
MPWADSNPWTHESRKRKTLTPIRIAVTDQLPSLEAKARLSLRMGFALFAPQ